MKYFLASVVLIWSLLGPVSDAAAACTSHTIILPDGKVLFCTTCCTSTGSSCTTTCL